MLRAAATLALLATLSSCGAIPDGREPARPSHTQARLPQATSPSPQHNDARLCMATLTATGARFSPLPDRYLAPGCNQIGTVQLDRLGADKGAVSLSNIGPLACPVANTLAGWARFGVDRAARQYLGSPLARIETMGSYACRNIAGTTQLSAHSRAEAVDISAFILQDGRRISVKNDWHGGSREEREFLRTVHKSACKRFGTVLGPEYNAAHRDHFHVEGQDASFCR